MEDVLSVFICMKVHAAFLLRFAFELDRITLKYFLIVSLGVLSQQKKSGVKVLSIICGVFCKQVYPESSLRQLFSFLSLTVLFDFSLKLAFELDRLTLKQLFLFP